MIDYFALALQQLREHEREGVRGMEEQAEYAAERDKLCPIMSRPDLGCWDSNGRWNGHEVACYKNRCALWFDGNCAFVRRRRALKVSGCHVPED